MQIVIDIPEEDYNLIKGFAGGLTISLYKAVQDGTPLPKGHGDLIDRDDLLVFSYKTDSKYYMYDEVVDVNDIKSALAIIEADKN